MFLVESPDEILDLDALRHELGEVGESVVVAGDRSAARVHVHGAQPDLAIAVGLRAGRLSDIAIVDLDVEAADPSHHPAAGAATGRAPARSRSLGLVVVAEAEGRPPSSRAWAPRSSARRRGSRRPSPDAEAEHVLLLIAGDDDAPADPPGAATTARIVARDVGALVAAALAFDPVATPEANVARMTSEAERRADVRRSATPATSPRPRSPGCGRTGATASSWSRCTPAPASVATTSRPSVRPSPPSGRASTSTPSSPARPRHALVVALD